MFEITAFTLPVKMIEFFHIHVIIKKGVKMIIDKWYCDICGELTDSIESTEVTMIRDEDGQYSGFRIIHDKCLLEKKRGETSEPISSYLGADGLIYLTSYLSQGRIWNNYQKESICEISDFDEYIDFLRRLQIPNYEEARIYFSNNDLLDHKIDANEIGPYQQDELKEIIKKYSNK